MSKIKKIGENGSDENAKTAGTVRKVRSTRNAGTVRTAGSTKTTVAIIHKELKLSASCLSYVFILFGLMFFVPGYPVLCGAFFVTLGIFQSFQNVRETNDILFSALLPVSKKTVVKGKYLFVCFIELCSLLLMSIVVALRMTVLSEAAVYRSNALMNGNLFALGLAFCIFGIFNSIFLGSFFKTAYKIGPAFIGYIVTCFLVIGLGEALHYVPGLAFLNAFGTESLGTHLALLLAGVTVYALLTAVSYRKSCRRFEEIDL